MIRAKEFMKYILVEIIGYLIFILAGIIIRRNGLYYIFANLVAFGFEILIKYILCLQYVYEKRIIEKYDSFIIFIGIEIIGVVFGNINRVINIKEWILIIMILVFKFICNSYNLKNRG